MEEKKKWSYEELDAFITDITNAMLEAREGGSYVKAFEHALNKDFRGYGWLNSDLKPFMTRGYDETMRVALGAEMSGHGGWKYPVLERFADPEQGMIVFEWLMESPWPAVEDGHYTGFYRADGTGYTVHWYAGNMESMEQEDLGVGQPLQWSHELGLASGQMSKTLEDQFYLRRMKEKQAMLSWRDHLEDLQEEYQGA